ncbi:MAG: DUF3459 domain-containing protein [Proteobacteria bacterium]|nr:DUF3459 domain-containing protein [Pseudomonadota bacterium]
MSEIQPDSEASDSKNSVSRWWEGAVIYQIWPRSFSDSDGDGIGDLKGIIGRLDYLNDGDGGGLGVDAIWLSPIYPSPLADFGYDVSGYTEVDPTFGTLDVFDELITEAHNRGMRVVLDWVPNHTSDQHPWFVESRADTTNTKRDWYVWQDPGTQGAPPNNWISAFLSAGPAWTLDERTGQYYLHSYTSSQPDLNWDNPAVRDAMLDTMRFWFDRGVDGFRIDVVHRLGKDPAFRDNDASGGEPEPTGPGRHDADWHTVHDRIRLIRSVADEYEDRLLVGEVYMLSQASIVEYVSGGDQLHLAHNFVFLNLPWSARSFGDTIAEFEALAGIDLTPAWCLNNHDHTRIRSRFDEDRRGEARARAAALLLLGLRGTIFIYQGEELGLLNSDVPQSLIVDVDGRDGARTPIPWERPSIAGPGAGFTSGQAWLPLGSNAEALNVASLTGQDGSILELYRKLLRLRSAVPALRHGLFEASRVLGDVFAFERRESRSAVMVVVNFSTVRQPMVPTIGDSAEYRLLVTSLSAEPAALEDLEPLEARWIQRGSIASV